MLHGGGLDNPFMEEEVWRAVNESLEEKLPGLDGFSGTFFQSCGSIIKDDIMVVFNQFYLLVGVISRR